MRTIVGCTMRVSDRIDGPFVIIHQSASKCVRQQFFGEVTGELRPPFRNNTGQFDGTAKRFPTGQYTR